MHLIYSTVDWCSEALADTTKFIRDKATALGQKVPFVGRTVEVITHGVVGTFFMVYSVAMSVFSGIGNKIGQVVESENFQAFWIRQRERGDLMGRRGQGLLNKGWEYVGEKVDDVVAGMKMFGKRVPVVGRTIQHGINGTIGVARVIYALAIKVIAGIGDKIGAITGNHPLRIFAGVRQRAAETMGERGVELISSAFQYAGKNKDIIGMIGGMALLYVGYPILGGILFFAGSIEFLANIDQEEREDAESEHKSIAPTLKIAEKEFRGEITECVQAIAKIINGDEDLQTEYLRLYDHEDFMSRLRLSSEGNIHFGPSCFADRVELLGIAEGFEPFHSGYVESEEGEEGVVKKVLFASVTYGQLRGMVYAANPEEYIRMVLMNLNEGFKKPS